MNITAAKQQIKDTVEAYLRRDEAGMYAIAPSHQRPIFLLGAPGIGKTAIMDQVAGELEIGIVSYSMTHHTRQSALGLPRIEHRTFDGHEFDTSEYTMSEIVAAIYDYMERTGLRQGILFLDEINCVSETLYPSMLQFLQFKTFGKHRVPDGWVVVCAGNPPEYNRSVHEFDIVTLDRLREIDVEPDYAAWKGYAVAKGLHPAVTTFLEAKKECFYKVESKPGGGKAFVTARGWEDLAQIIALYEDMGKPVNRELFVQFLRDGEIADQFSVYYALFEKYRSDYQVDAILAGEASDAIRRRAREAEFDERIALISLMLDVLGRSCAKVLEHEGVVIELRDVLRAAKGRLLTGSTADEVLGPRIAEREAALARKLQAGTAAESLVRRERLVILKLKDFAAACALAKAHGGEAAFRVVEEAYKAEVSSIQPMAKAASAQMDNAFDFVDACFGSREMLVFMAELATRKPTTQFVAHYGNERYYAHNQELQVDAARMGLVERASMLADLSENIKLADSRPADTGSAVGLSVGGTSRLRAADAAGAGEDEDADAVTGAGEDAEAPASTDAVTGASADAEASASADAMKGASADAEVPASADAMSAHAAAHAEDACSGAHVAVQDARAASAGANAESAGVAGGAMSASGVLSEATLAAHYGDKHFEFGFASICKMVLPTSDLKGKKVLDVCCRRGKGVFKLSSMVGDRGSVIGVDWNRLYIEEAKDRMDRAWRESGLARNNMDFRVAYPEDLVAAGIGPNTMDVVYVNNVVTLFFDQKQALREFGRVLRPGGLLIMETTFADRPRNEEVVAKARAIGNSIQAAYTQQENRTWLEAAGFGAPSVVEEYEVEASRGYKPGSTVEVVEGDEDVCYKAVALYVYKK